MKNLNNTPCKQPLNFQKATKCSAKTRKYTKCQSPAMKNGRCRMHGGKSTGAKTKEGLERIIKANFKYGFYTKKSFEERKLFAKLLRADREFLRNFNKEIQ